MAWAQQWLCSVSADFLRHQFSRDTRYSKDDEGLAATSGLPSDQFHFDNFQPRLRKEADS
eukprot:scaffold517273_cov24-Prasinocladus_malaysianus.AAC.1